MTDDETRITIAHNQFLVSRFERSVDRIVADLEHLAISVENDKALRNSSSTTAPYTSAATRIIEKIMNAMPNLGLGILTQAAHDADTLIEDVPIQ